MDDAIEVRPFAASSEYEAMVDYFLDGGDAFLRGMGVNVSNLPAREDWLGAVLADHELADRERNRLYLAWLFDGKLVGHSSLSHIKYGDTANCHLHLWQSPLRRSGHGSAFLTRSIDIYFERFQLGTLASEPFAENLAPGAALRKFGFRSVRRFRTIPSGLAFEQEVERFEVGRDEWFARRGETGSR
ncbi:MAG: ribosomal-protein-alanine N-acetyltransferase [Chlamydiales bacterium]|jgi:ribosomal-protein-alanine N-acetyltransferase